MKFKDKLLAHDLRKYQKDSGLTLDQIQDKTGVLRSTLSRIRHGKKNAKFIEVCEVAFMLGEPLMKYVELDEVK